MKPFKLLAPAKLNLFLHIIVQREDGYHKLQTIFRLIDLYDELTFTLREDNQIYLITQQCDIEKENNLIYQAYQLLQSQTHKLSGIDIHLNKKIPIGAGLGGGSSDAATTLIALNQLFHLNLTQEELKTLGIQLGADVPVFIEGKTCWGEGIGEKLTPITLPENYYVLLIPNCFVSTVSIYKDKQLNRHTPKITLNDYQFETTHNDLEPVACRKNPDIQEAIDWLSQFALARMTGSGSAVFAPCESKEKAEEILKQKTPPGKVLMVKGL